jgi:AraC family transcriptional regulator of adaptative response / DNA-3-methyladenine glycosylase II
MVLIEDGVVDRDGVTGLANRLGVSDRHLRRELQAEVGAGPVQLARLRRLRLARLLLDQTNLSITDVAFASGFGSVRQFNDAFQRTFAAAPSEIRRRPSLAGAGSTELTLHLSGRGPVGWPDLHRFLRARAVPGLEQAIETDGGAGRFRRGVPGGWIELAGTDQSGPGRASAEASDDRLLLRCRLDRLDRLADLVPRVRRVADLDTDRNAVTDHLVRDPLLAERLAHRPLPPLPGAFDPFELAVRAVVGQQVSVAGAATTVANLLTLVDGASTDGPAVPPTAEAPESDHPDTSPERPLRPGFPTPEAVAAAPLERLGMPVRRRETIRALAQAVADGDVDLSSASSRDEVETTLLAIPGIGPWTAGYIALRALADPDGWPDGDLVLRRSLDPAAPPSAVQLAERAQRWQPWRGYAAMLLWATAEQHSTDSKQSKRSNEREQRNQ